MTIHRLFSWTIYKGREERGEREEIGGGVKCGEICGERGEEVISLLDDRAESIRSHFCSSSFDLERKSEEGVHSLKRGGRHPYLSKDVKHCRENALEKTFKIS